ncbi:MAG: L-histidine N(alpha)-methyltransferase [Acidobacteriota bacterium]
MTDTAEAAKRSREATARDVLQGLRATPKTIHCKYFYDAVGSELFERICELEEYYPTRTELAIMRRSVMEMADRLGPRLLLIEYGSGSGRKTELLLDALDEPATYLPIDISPAPLQASAGRLIAHYPDLEVVPLCADYTVPFELPAIRSTPRRRAVYFPGSTIGNFGPEASRHFLRRIAQMCGAGGALLIGVDLVKDAGVLQRAYDDAAGVTAAFNLNLLVRFNRELAADFDTDRFRHKAVYDIPHQRIEMYLVSQARQEVQIAGETVVFGAGEEILTEYSYKYTLEGFRRLAQDAGFRVECVWTDDQDLFSVQYLTVSRG